MKYIKLFVFSLVTVAVIYFLYNRLLVQNQIVSLPTPQPTQNNQNDKPQIVSTKPDPLQDTIISSTEIIEITFNRSLENVGEFKLRIEPKTEVKVELSGDRKTAKILPETPYLLGTGFTLSIGPDTKFDGVGNWGESKDFHFRTIKYSGI